jgi:hypothetical protein
MYTSDPITQYDPLKSQIQKIQSDQIQYINNIKYQPNEMKYDNRVQMDPRE